MLDIGPEKLLVVAVIAMVVLGPQGIPRLARGLGRARAEIRRLTAEVPPETLNVLTNPRGALLDAVSGPRDALAHAVEAPRSALADAIADFKLASPIAAGVDAVTPDDPTLN